MFMHLVDMPRDAIQEDLTIFIDMCTQTHIVEFVFLEFLEHYLDTVEFG